MEIEERFMFESLFEVYPSLREAIANLWLLSIWFPVMYGLALQFASTCFYPMDEIPWFLKFQYAFHPFLRKWHRALRPLYSALGTAWLAIALGFRFLALSEIWHSVGADDVRKMVSGILSLQAVYLALEAFWPRHLGPSGVRIARVLGVFGKGNVELVIRMLFFLMSVLLQAMPHVSYVYSTNGK
jgi:hypothetical protein